MGLEQVSSTNPTTFAPALPRGEDFCQPTDFARGRWPRPSRSRSVVAWPRQPPPPSPRGSGAPLRKTAHKAFRKPA
eukprot:3906931-Prymnesium_polylepis.1